MLLTELAILLPGALFKILVITVLEIVVKTCSNVMIVLSNC